MPSSERKPEFRSALDAAAATANMLVEAGLEFSPDTDDLDSAADVVRAVAANPASMPTAALLSQTPAALLMTRQILEEFGHKVVEDAEKVRHLVMNKLVIETENPDPRVRLRSLELLGKMGDVGLFTEKKEVTITHQTSDDVRERLRARLARLVPAELEIEDAEVVEDEIFDPPRAGSVEDDEIFAPPRAGSVEDDEIFDLSLEPRLASPGLFDE